jgi:O-antigen/teichoic acid export membrane protein
MVILFFLGVTYVGFFSVGQTIATQMVSAALMLGRVLMPRMMESYGVSGDTKDLRRFFIVPARLSAVFLGPVVAVGIILTEFVFMVILPNYEPGLLPAKILLCGVAFRAVWSPVNQVFLAIKKQWRLTLIFFITIPVAAVLNVAAVKLGMELPGVAVAAMLSDFGFVSVVLLVALQEFHASAWRRLAELARIYSPLAVAGLAMAAAHWARHSLGLGESHTWGPIAESAVFCLVYGVPLALLVLQARGRRFLGFTELGG